MSWNRAALGILIAVFAALAIFVLPGWDGFVTLLTRTGIALAGALLVALLAATMWNNRWLQPAVVLIGAAAAVAIWSLVAERPESTISGGTGSVGDGATPSAAGRSDVGVNALAAFTAIATKSSGALDAIIAALPDPGGNGILTTDLVLSESALREVAAGPSATPEDIAAAEAEVNAAADAETAEIVALETGLSDALATGLREAAMARAEAKRTAYLRRLELIEARAEIVARALGFLLAHPGEYYFYEDLDRAIYPSAVLSQEFELIMNQYVGNRMLEAEVVTDLVAALGQADDTMRRLATSTR